MPTICFGQQPSGFFPKRFLIAKIYTARKLREKIGGKIVYFYHDSDADYRETVTLMRDIKTGQEVRLNFTQENKIQKKHSPLYLKRISSGWKEEILKQLPRFVDQAMIDIFKSVEAKTAGDFCLEMYKKMGLLDGIEVVRSSDISFREQAAFVSSRVRLRRTRDPLTSDKLLNSRDSSSDALLGMTPQGDWFADVEYQGEIVRAKIENDGLSLHEGGQVYTKLPKAATIAKLQITPGKDERFNWMNSVIGATHYIYGEGENDYLKFTDFPDVKFIERETINEPNFAWIG